VSEITFRNKVVKSDPETVRFITKSTGFFEAVADEIDCAVGDVSDVLEHGEEAAGSYYIFMELDGETIGYASYGSVECTDGLFFMYWIVVRGDIRGKGYGKLLMRRAIEEQKARGARKVVLQTSGREQYLPTRKFYIACGFTREAEITDFYLKGESTVYYTIEP